MKVKFNKKIEDYKYILSFDIAKHRTGFSVLEIKTQKVVYVGTVCIDTLQEFAWGAFYDQLKENIKQISEKFGDSFFITKERLPNQGGPRSNIAALQELAKSHAIFDLLITQMGLDFYDYDGVHSVSVRAYFKNRFAINKPSKEDVYKCVCKINNEFEFPQDNYDITDSVGVALALINKKWNSDIDAQIKILNKEKKELKARKAIKEKGGQISFLESIKIRVGDEKEE